MSSAALRPRLLSQCLACLVAETPGQRKTLETLATRTGFGGISVDEDGPGLPDRNDRRLPFFFFHCQVPSDLLRSTLGHIRHDDRLRFSPSILIVGKTSQSEVMHYISLGFDDIVILPEAARVLERRFNAQLSSPLSYFETATYFGPDRRRSLRLNADSAEKRKPGEHRHVRYLIQRGPLGVDILRREVVITANPPPPKSTETISFG